MKYAYRDVLGSLTREKKKGDGTLTRFVFRPLSYPVSWLFLAAGWTPNAVTALGGVCCALAFLFALTPVYFLHVAAVVLFLVFAVLDCTDGNMAR
ncbi:MAG TPA: CDP-alcohol phosphatidyltransferase family protein, partial [Treponemataceae bacterium]|nr:CDP-alcohol phosphatidyltransferase family protein [Treponemataceae bacterium]